MKSYWYSNRAFIESFVDYLSNYNLNQLFGTFLSNYSSFVIQRRRRLNGLNAQDSFKSFNKYSSDRFGSVKFHDQP